MSHPISVPLIINTPVDTRNASGTKRVRAEGPESAVKIMRLHATKRAIE